MEGQTDAEHGEITQRQKTPEKGKVLPSSLETGVPVGRGREAGCTQYREEYFSYRGSGCRKLCQIDSVPHPLPRAPKGQTEEATMNKGLMICVCQESDSPSVVQ